MGKAAVLVAHKASNGCMILSMRVAILPSVVLCLAGCSSSPEAIRSTEIPGAGTPTKIISAQSQEQPAAPASAAVSARLREIAVGGRLGEMERPDFSDYRKNVQVVYEAANYAPLWLNADQPTAQASGVIKALEGSAQKGLNPADYDAARWSDRVNVLKSSTDANRAEFDAALTVATMRYISDLHVGRVNPKHFKFGIDVQSKKYDLPQFVLQQVVHAGDVQAVLNSVEPPHDGYRRMEAALQQYLQLQARGDGPKVPELTTSVAVGDAYAGVGPLVARLRLLGDMPGGVDVHTYDGSVSAAVKHFQERHGLSADGKLGAATVKALNVPVADRTRQITDAMERWRWLPVEFAEPPVVVNIPEFRLRAYGAGEKIALAMNVVVGKAAPTQTPVFTDSIKFIVFRPYWNVPSGILRRTVIPGIEKSSGYIQSQRFEITDSSGRPVAASGNVVAGLRSGKYSIRQKPGPKNSLGLVKFMFPNSYSVYLHSTPSTELFAQSRRDFSSGCIRVEKPAELAAFLLRNQSDGGQQWTVERAQAAMDSGKDNQQVNLKTSVPVLLLYTTAVTEEDGTLHFFDDIYGHDRKLNTLLAKGPPYP
jgi:murein L,D-transpeptidase YcbB/YkuD